MRAKNTSKEEAGPGARFGRYRIQKALAEGGMARVWLAESEGAEGFRKKVVLKTMLPALATNRSIVTMFIDEAAVAARFEHDNIVRVFDFGCIDEQYFIAMEYVAGRTVRQILSRARKLARPLGAWLFLRVMASVCEALDYVHTLVEDGKPLGLVHRDVSPENIMVSFTGTVKLVDFGVAHCAKTNASTGMVVGKYRYMAPERLNGSPGESRSDLYSVGVILYELLAGGAPFVGKAEPALWKSILAGAAPLRSVAPDVPERLAAIVDKAIAREAKDRYESAAELGAALMSYLTSTDPGAVTRSLSTVLSVLYAGADDLPSNVRRMDRSATKDSQARAECDTENDIEIEIMADPVRTEPSNEDAAAPVPEVQDTTPKALESPADDDILARLRERASQPPIATPVIAADVFARVIQRTMAASLDESPPRPAPRPAPREDDADPFTMASRRSSAGTDFDLFSLNSLNRSTADFASGPDPFAIGRRIRVEPADEPPSSSGPSSAPESMRSWRPEDWGFQSSALRAASFDKLDDAGDRAPRSALEEGLAAIRKGNYAEALRHWERALEATPDDRVLMTNLKRLKKRIEAREK